MSLYVYVCEDSHKTERLRPVEERDMVTVCSVCGKIAKRVYENGTLALIIEGGTIKG